MAVVDEATAIIEDAQSQGVLLRLIGGLAFRVQAPGWPGRTSDTPVDIDLVAASPNHKRVGEVLRRYGYVPDVHHNALIEPITVPLADLLLSKLQIVKLNTKDALDVLALMACHPTSLDDERISVPRILEHTSRLWGWWRTVSANLDWIGAFAKDESERAPPWTAGYDPRTQAAQLRSEIDRSSKTLGWTLRSRIGDRLPWYDSPEEVQHGG